MRAQAIALVISALIAGSASAALTSGRITEVGRTSEARASHTATRLADGRVLIAGGMERNGVFFASADIFDATANTFRVARHAMTMKRVSHSATLLGDGRVLIAGGWATQDRPVDEAEIFDPRSETFAATGKMTMRRTGQTATLLPNGTVLLAGGYDGERNVAAAEIFDPKTKRFTAIGRMNSARVQHSATTLSDGAILIAGGEASRDDVVASAEIFDPTTNKFTPVAAAMTVARYKHDAIRMADGRVLLIGGSDASDWRGQRKSAEIFDPKTKTFTATSDMTYTRFKMDGSMMLLKDGRVFIGGGGERAEIFDPKTNSFSVVDGAFGMPLHYASVTSLGDGRALVVGGYGNGTPAQGPVATNRAWVFTN